MRKKKGIHQKTVRRKMISLLVGLTGLIVPFVVLMVIMLVHTNSTYAIILKNASTAADFNSAFKTTIDSRMYSHVIEPRTGDDEATLPLADVDDAVRVLERLAVSTTLPDNKWRIQSMLNWCENLRNYMVEIANTPHYDDRMTLLDRNIRGETGLTVLIETYMHDYLDAEVREMVRLQSLFRTRTYLFILVSILLAVLLVISGIGSSVRISRAIALPIRTLSETVSRFGNGNFTSAPIASDVIELNTLHDGIDEMARRIDLLMKTQIDNQRSLHKAELELLQAQINPHFLYNTLDSIAILAESDRAEDAVAMVNSLSTFFRVSLSKGKDVISIASELNHVRSYLQIQQLRYSDILQYTIDVPDELLSHDVPKLVLQPLVENALYHGIKNRRGIGHIKISGCIAGDDILLRVEDDGAGMEEQQIRNLQTGIYEDRHTGLGLVNVHKRIRLYCGEPYGLSFAQRPGQGTIVTIRLPLSFQHDEKEE